MNKIVLVVLWCVALITPVAAVDAPIGVPAGAKYLDEMDLADATCGAGRTPRPRHTVEGGPISLAGKVFDRGLGVHAPFEFKFFANGAATRFTANVGVDDDMKDRPLASVRFLVLADDRVAADSGVLRAGARAALDADLAGAKWVTLKVTDAGDGYACDHADWADAAFVFKPGAKWGNALLSRQLGILTPPESPAPRINGPSVFGVRPGHPILYRLPVTGERPMKLSVEGLPAGATFDAASGLLGGAVSKPGDYVLVFTAENVHGVAKKNFTLKVGNTICLTPPLGWNSWNCWGQDVTDEKMRRAADAMVASGLADHGWSYIVVDDCWRTRPTEKEAGMKRPGWIGERAYMYGPARTADDLPCTNPTFPDMRAMIAYIHAKGLKAGLYSVPATVACCWTWGSFGHEAKDAEVWADWGVDLLKYDWCTADRDWWRAGTDRERQFKAYKLMGDLLARQKRDIVYNVCNYGRHGVTEWARAAGGQYWRTNDDLKDTWPLLIRSINENMNVADAAAPGGWNDPDMLVVGPMRSNGFTTSRLTPNEQYAHISLWAIMAVPLFIGCDLERLDPLAHSLLTNDEVLDIDQDVLGKAGRPVVHTPDYDVWLRPLADGSWAIALFNRTWEEREIAADFKVLGLPASCAVRDVWAQRDLGVFIGRFAASIPGHAALLYRLRSAAAPTAVVPPEKMKEVYETVKTPYKRGMVLTPENGEMLDNPSVFRHKDAWYMIFIRFDGKGYETHLAKSDDLIRWQRLGCIFQRGEKGAWDASQADGWPSLADTRWDGPNTLNTFNGRYWMMYLGGAKDGYETDPLSTGVAWTDDPSAVKQWTRCAGNPVLQSSDPAARAFERATIYKHFTVEDSSRACGGRFVNFYNAADKVSHREAIGMAVSDDMLHWRRVGDMPVIENGDPKKHSISGDPMFRRIGDLWVMFYFGYQWRPGGAFDTFACSYDLQHWTKWDGEPLIKPSADFDRVHAHKPWVLKHNGVVYHYYCAVGSKGRGIALATSAP